MFGFLKKKIPTNALDKFIFAIYGNPPPPKRANVEMAITIASSELLMGIVVDKVVSISWYYLQPKGLAQLRMGINRVARMIRLQCLKQTGWKRGYVLT